MFIGEKVGEDVGGDFEEAVQKLFKGLMVSEHGAEFLPEFSAW